MFYLDVPNPKNPPPHLAGKGFETPKKREMWCCKQIVLEMESVRTEGGGEESSKGKDPPLYISTAM